MFKPLFENRVLQLSFIKALVFGIGLEEGELIVLFGPLSLVVRTREIGRKSHSPSKF